MSNTRLIGSFELYERPLDPNLPEIGTEWVRVQIADQNEPPIRVAELLLDGLRNYLAAYPPQARLGDEVRVVAGAHMAIAELRNKQLGQSDD